MSKHPGGVAGVAIGGSVVFSSQISFASRPIGVPFSIASSYTQQGTHLFIDSVRHRTAEGGTSVPFPAVTALRDANACMEALRKRGVPVGGSLVLGLSREDDPEATTGYELHRFQKYSGGGPGEGSPVLLTSNMALRRDEVEGGGVAASREPRSGRFFTIDPHSSAADLDARCVCLVYVSACPSPFLWACVDSRPVLTLAAHSLRLFVPPLS